MAAAPLIFKPDAGFRGFALLVGTQTLTGSSRGIYSYRFDPESGSLIAQGLAAAVEQPTYLALSPDRQYLFSCNETGEWMGQKGGGVSSWRIDSAAEGPVKLTYISSQPSQGADTTHVGLDPSGRTLLAANYTGGSASSFSVTAHGQISPVVSHFQYSGHGLDPTRQDAPHVHRAIASPDGRYALFADLGLDCIHIYHLDPHTAQLTPNAPAAWHSRPGAGPRALRFHPNHRWVYLVAELSSSVYVLHWAPQTGTLTTVQEILIKPDHFQGRAQASDIVLDRAGRFAYAACRYYDYVYTYSVSPQDGRLTLAGVTEVGGRVPRDLTLDPSERWLLLANQESDTITIHRRDPVTGKLADRFTSVPISRPQCLRFLAD